MMEGKIRKSKRFLLTCVLVLLFFHNPLYAQSSYWVQQGPAGDGTESNPFATIQEGISAAEPGDEVIVLPGIYTGAGNRNLVINEDITVRSQGGPDVTTIDCEGSSSNPARAFYINSQTIIEGFTIKNGYEVGPGGAIYISDGYPTIRNCVIINNTSVHGTMYEYGMGGGIVSSRGVHLENCIIQNNSAEDWGSGLCIFMYAANHNVEISNCIFSGNTNEGAIIYKLASGGNYEITNCTISNNGGDGIVLQDLSADITNSIIWGNSGNQIFLYSASANVNYCCIQDGWASGNGNINTDPQFQSDYSLLPPNDCINGGDPNATFPAEDILGVPRPQEGRYDMGAYEYQGADTDADGMPDWWENQYPGQLDPNSNDAFIDTDNDGFFNLREYIGGTDPTLDTSQPAACTIYVEDGATGVSNGTQGKPFPTIQTGIDLAANGDTVLVADGTYQGPQNQNVSFNGKSIVVTSQNGPEVTIIDCEGTDENQNRGFIFNSGENNGAQLDGFTITKDYNMYGAAIYCVNTSPKINNCIITDNTAKKYVGAYYCTYSGVGGGIYCESGSPTISNCKIFKNYSVISGGGIYCYSGSNVTIVNSILTGNDAYSGAGLYMQDTSATLTNCTINDNQLHPFFGGQFGGGIACLVNSSVTVQNSIIWGNEDEEVYVGESSATVTYSNVEGGYDGTGNIAVDPKFGPGWHLQATSPCIDQG